jgi:transposase
LKKLEKPLARWQPGARWRDEKILAEEPKHLTSVDLDFDLGARLWYLPPYSPDLNPIEQAFAKIKHWMRQAQKRTLEDTWRHIGHLAEAIEPSECSNYFANAGYASIKI